MQILQISRLLVFKKQKTFITNKKVQKNEAFPIF